VFLIGGIILSTNDIKSDQFAELRKKAEKILNNRENKELEDLKEMTINETLLVVHRLEVHQIELELQNEELRETQFELEKTCTRYYELFDLAPIACFYHAKAGKIKDGGLIATNYLNETREELMQKERNEYIEAED